MARSSTSSLADDYYHYAASDAPSDDSYHRQQDSFPLPPRSQPHSLPSQPQPAGLKKHTSLAQISVPSFSAFRSQTSGIPVTATRHSTSLQPSPRPTSFSAAEQASPRIAEPASRPLSLDSPLPRHPSGLAYILTPPLTTETVGKRERLSYAQPPRVHDRSHSIDSRLARTESVSSRRTSRRSSIPAREQDAHEQPTSHAQKPSRASIDTLPLYSSADREDLEDTSMIGAQPSPALNLQLEGVQRTLSDDSLLSDKQPKSPSRLGALFGWKSSPPKSGTESPTTTFSDRSLSPAPSPKYQKPLPMEPDGVARLAPAGLDIGKANGATYFDHPTTPIYLSTPEGNAHVQDLERELSQVSEELAGSIRREMELEDELERLRLELPTLPSSEAGRRSSDYFSDSGASSTKFPISDPDAKIEQVERLRRKAEQDKAQVMADNAQRLQTEMTKRRELEQLVQSLEEQMQDKSRNEDERLMLSEKVTELETSLDETKRRLVDEKKAKDNFEDLYSATREELEQRRNERDNLRDEILPRMKERLEGLEQQAADHQALLYENTRMSQELNALKHEQGLFYETQRMSQAGNPHMFDMIAEEKDIVSPIIGGPPRAGLSRSGSLARSSSRTRGSINRSDSVKGREGGRQRSGSSGPLSAEAQKEIEDQRDALHKALKLLISRYDKQTKDHQRAIKKLNKEKKAADLRAGGDNPKRSQYTREVSFLKEEVTALRRRTEDALEQKWEYEKGLSGIKMDLDRAEQETRGLRHLLQEQDIVVTNPEAPSDPGQDQLSFSTSTAKSERDYARRMAEAFRQRALNLQETLSSDSSDENQPPAVAQLFDSANRMDELAEQLDAQVRSNSDLRSRLTEAVEKGESEQRESTRLVEEMQQRLAKLEDAVLAAAAHSETTLSSHEGEVRRLEEASSPRLQRLETPVPEPSKLSPNPASTSVTPASSPALKQGQIPALPAKRPAPAAASLADASRTHILERAVREMEFTLREAEAEMQRVLQRVNRGQAEVAELTGRRDRAVGELRRLKGAVGEEERRAGAVA